ncbi:MAG TPA: sigma 54-interacting transcriptional regulator [Terriglobales bacterium]|jgi:Nif-specific regulatory protein
MREVAAVNPRLTVVSGPYEDPTFPLSQDETTIGRDPLNMLSIPDPSLSRRHCLLTREGDGFKIRDLESRNGTYVNGTPVNESWLKDGDQLSIGDSIFIFQTGEDSDQRAYPSVVFDDSVTQATAQLHPQDVIYLHPEQILKQLPATSRLTRNLNALLKASRVVHSISDLDSLQAQILTLIFDESPAERGAILLDYDGVDRFASVFVRERVPGANPAVQVSRTVASQVVEKGVAILGSDVRSSMKDVGSLIASNVRSLICVPLTVFQRVTGCIYVDTTKPASRLDEDHLQMVAAIAGISAVALENARRLQWLEEENLRLTTESHLEHNMVGESGCIKEIYRTLSRVAKADSNVLIEGESGTGKELAARAIHRSSPRSGKPFLAINCAAIPEGLLETELFGNEKGAYTSAVSQRKGKFEVADGGVVFLDEIGELAPPLQVKLLRVLQEREFERVGGTRKISVNIRLIAATNKDLKDAVRQGTFRQDLYFRLNVVSILMPALRDRRDDIPMLAKYFLSKHSQKSNLKPKPFSEQALTCLKNYDWPGNVRELENAVERALVMSVSDVILPEDLPEPILETGVPTETAVAKYHAALKERKRELITEAVEAAKGNYTEAARALGVHPNYLHRLIRNLELKNSLRTVYARGDGKAV